MSIKVKGNPFPEGYTCIRCGKCCLYRHFMMTLSATSEDVSRWKREERYDILKYVSTISPDVHDLWVKNGEESHRCPFVRKDRGKPTYRCGIYETRPEVCKGYPHGKKCLNWQNLDEER